MSKNIPPEEPLTPAMAVPRQGPTDLATTQEKPKRKVKLGSWSLVLGIFGIIFAFIPGASKFGILLAVVALILGGIGLLRKGGRALTGTILGVVALVLGIIFLSLSSSGPSTSPAPAAGSSKTAPSSTAAATPKEAAPPAKSAAPTGTVAQLQALAAADGYLTSGPGFSQAGLIAQLTSSSGNGFAQSDAEYAVAHSGADWNAQAVTAAKGYLASGPGFSRDSMIQQLTSPSGSQFTQAQAEYAVDQVGLK